MSSMPPSDPSQPAPEYLGDAAPPAEGPPSRRKLPVLGGVALGVAAVVGLGGWGVYALMSGGGAQPSEAVPANALAYVSLDLDPSASQKVEAIKILKKFPALEKKLEVDSGDDLRRWVFDEGFKDCDSVDYAKDVEPWIGDRVAMAAVPAEKAGEDPSPLIALKVTDTEAAEKGIAKLAECGETGDDFGFAFAGDYALISDGEQKADDLAAAVEEGSLADDAEFQDWTDKVGDPGFVTAYVAPEAGRFLLEMSEQENWFAYDAAADAGMPPPPMMEERMEAMAKNFKGMAGVVRFADGAVEAEFVGQGVPEGMLPDSAGTSAISELPDGTAVAMSIALSEGWLDSSMKQLEQMMPPGESLEDLMAQAEAQTGLKLPEDVEALLGDGVSVAVDGDLDVASLMSAPDPTRVPAGIRVSGEPDEILPVVEKIKALLGPDSEMLVVESGDGVVSFGLSQEYVKSLAAEGSLGDQETFAGVVPEADRATGALFVDFDAVSRWVDEGMQAAGGVGESEVEVAENLEPLKALGMSAWIDDDTQHGLLRITTD